MPVVPIRIRDSQKGTIWDSPPSEISPSIMSDTKNVRLIDSTLERMGGLKECGSVANSKAVFGISQAGVNKLLLFTDSAVYITSDADTFSSTVTPAAGITSSSSWSVSQIGDNVIATSIENVPILLTAGSSQFGPFTNWPATYKCRNLVPFNGHLVAAGIQISGTEKNGLVKWSDTFDPANLASVAWDHQDLTLLSGEKTLVLDSAILDFGALRNTAIIYGKNQTFKMTPTTASVSGVPLVFAFEILFEEEGIFAGGCFVEANGEHYVVGGADIYKHNGIQRQSISDGRATDKVVKAVISNTGSEIFCGHNPQNKEIFFAYAPGFSGFPLRALLYNYSFDAWTSMDFSETSTQVPFSHFANSSAPSSSLTSYDESDNVYSDLNHSVSTYALAATADSELSMYILSPTLSKVYKLAHELASSTIAPTALIERKDLDLDEYFKTVKNMKYISRTIPLFDGAGAVSVYVGGRNNLGEEVTYGSATTFTIGTNYKVDHRSTYRFPAIKFEQSDTNMSSFAGMDLHVQEAQGR